MLSCVQVTLLYVVVILTSVIPTLDRCGDHIDLCGDHIDASGHHIYIYNSILIWELTILKSGARTPRTVTKFAVKTAIDLTQTIYGWNFNFRSISIVFCPFCELIFLTSGLEPN